MKKNAKKIIIIIAIAAIVVTSCLSAMALSVNPDTYKLTSELTSADKSDSTQANYQTADVSATRYIEEFTQAVEWTNKEAGIGKVSLYYSASWEETTEKRSLYFMTNCEAHDFSDDIAAQNILDLLAHNDYVDVIIVYDNSNSDEPLYGDSMFTLMAEDLENLTLTYILEVINASDLSGYTYVYAIGSTSEEKDTSGEVTGDYTGFKEHAAHGGAAWFPQYLQSYYELITADGSDFDRTVEAIYLAFDAFVGYYRANTALDEFDFSDRSSLDMDLTDLAEVFPEAYAIMLSYDADGRYIVTTKDDDQEIDDDTSDLYRNLYMYLAFLMSPNYIIENQDYFRETNKVWSANDDLGTLLYGTTLSELGILDVESDVWTGTITLRVDSRFITDADQNYCYILDNSYSVCNITSVKADDDSGDRIITVTVTNEGDENITSAKIYAAIPIYLDMDTVMEGTTNIGFANENDDFDDVFTVDTVVTASKVLTYANEKTSSHTDTLSLASPKLYKQALYNLYYDLNGGTGTAPTDDNNYASKTRVLLASIPSVSDTGVTIIGWSLDDQYDVDSPLTDEPAEDPTISSVEFGDEDITVYAVYAVDRNNNDIPDYFETPLHLYYDLNEATGTAPTDSTEYLPDETATLVDSSSVSFSDTDIVFIGWSSTKQSNGSATNPLTSAPSEGVLITSDSVTFDNENITVYAVYAADRNNNNTPDYLENSYRLYYNMNGDEATAPTDGADYLSGETATLVGTNSVTPSTTGIVFIGWSSTQQTDGSAKNPLTSAPTEGIIIDSVEFVDSDITVYAVYAADRNGNSTPDYLDTVYHLTYNLNGATGTAPTDSTGYLTNETADLVGSEDVSFSETGIVFIGWSDTQQSSGSASNPLTSAPTEGVIIDDVTFIDSDITVYAVYAQDRNNNGVPDYDEILHLSYDLNGASGTTPTDSTNYIPGDSQNLADPSDVSITMGGIVLIGWSDTQLTEGSAGSPLTSAPAEGTLISSVTFTNSDITVYAVYARDRNNNGTPDYDEVLHLTYDMNGDSATAPIDSNDYIPDDTATLVAISSATPNTSGIVLIGWSLTEQTTGSAGNPLTSAPSDGVLVTSGSVTFDNEDITVYAVYAVDRNNNGTPDYDEILHLYYDLNDANGTVPTDDTNYIPGDIAYLVDEEDVTITSSDIVLIGWSETQLTDGSANSPLTSAPAEGTIIDSISFANSNITVYAVYAQDRNNNGTPDYDEILHLIYDMNGDGSTPPEDNNDYIPDDTATLADTDSVALNASGIVLIGWSRTQQSNGSAGNPLTSAPSDGVLITSGFVTFENDNITVYAVYARDRNNNNTPDYLESSYRLYYDLNEATGIAPEDNNEYLTTETATLVGSDSVSFSDTGIVFIGWSLTKQTDGSATSPLASAPGEGVLITSGSVTFDSESIIVYAVYAADRNNNGTPDYLDTVYHITYDLNGAQGTTPTDTTDYIAGDTASLVTSVNIDDPDLIFLGWSSSQVIYGSADDPLTSAPTEGLIITGDVTITGNVTYYAVYAKDRNNNNEPDYTEQTYKLTYNINGGNGTTPTDDNDYLTGETVDLDDGDGISYNGLTFLGWSTDCSCSVYSPLGLNDTVPTLIDETTFLDSNITVCAVWQQSTFVEIPEPVAPEVYYTLTYDLNDGWGTAPTDDTQYTSGTSVKLDDTTDYSYNELIFLGWSLSNSYNALEPLQIIGTIDLSDIVIDTVTFTDSNITVYAVWGTYPPTEPDEPTPESEEEIIVTPPNVKIDDDDNDSDSSNDDIVIEEVVEEVDDDVILEEDESEDIEIVIPNTSTIETLVANTWVLAPVVALWGIWLTIRKKHRPS